MFALVASRFHNCVCRLCRLVTEICEMWRRDRTDPSTQRCLLNHLFRSERESEHTRHVISPLATHSSIHSYPWQGCRTSLKFFYDNFTSFFLVIFSL